MEPRMNGSIWLVASFPSERRPSLNSLSLSPVTRLSWTTGNICNATIGNTLWWTRVIVWRTWIADWSESSRLTQAPIVCCWLVHHFKTTWPNYGVSWTFCYPISLTTWTCSNHGKLSMHATIFYMMLIINVQVRFLRHSSKEWSR